MHGNGERTSDDGNSYEGDYIEGKRHGKGKCVFSNGSFYDGDW